MEMVFLGLLAGQQGISLTLVISTVVIVVLAVAFSVFIWTHCKNKKKIIDGGLEDKTIKNDLLADYLKRRKTISELDGLSEAAAVKGGAAAVADSGDVKRATSDGYETLCGFLKRKSKSNLVLKIIINVVFAVFIAAVLAVTVLAFVARSGGGEFYLGDTSFFVIQTGSMAEKNRLNPYLDQLPDNQIAQYALVGVRKTSADSLKKFDVIAFKYNNVVYVHRIVEIEERDGEYYFTTMGDANSSSANWEKNITADRIIGRLNGLNSTFLGMLINYIQSEVGLIALVFALIFLVVADSSEAIVSKSLEKRTAYVAGRLDEEEDYTPEETDAKKDKKSSLKEKDDG